MSDTRSSTLTSTASLVGSTLKAGATTLLDTQAPNHNVAIASAGAVACSTSALLSLLSECGPSYSSLVSAVALTALAANEYGLAKTGNLLATNAKASLSYATNQASSLYAKATASTETTDPADHVSGADDTTRRQTRSMTNSGS